MDAHSFIEHNGDLFFIGRVTRPKNLEMAQWPNGPMAQWPNGPMAQWPNGCGPREACKITTHLMLVDVKAAWCKHWFR